MSGEPTRFIEDSAASVRMREALMRAKETPPVDYDVARGLVRLQTTMAGVAASAGLTAVGRSALLSKGLLGLSVVGLAGVVAVSSWLTRDPSGPSKVGEPQAPVRMAADRAAESVASRAETDRALIVGAEPEAATPVEVPALQLKRHAPRLEPVRDPDEQLRREIAHLAEARRQLAIDPSVAFRMSENGQREFDSGMFREEREAIAILALAELRRWDEVRIRARRFIERYPNSPSMERIQEVIGRLGAP